MISVTDLLLLTGDRLLSGLLYYTGLDRKKELAGVPRFSKGYILGTLDDRDIPSVVFI